MLSATQLAVGRPVAGQRRTTQRPVRGLVSMRASATLSQDVLVLDKCTPLGKRILLVPDEAEQKTAGGILIPTSAAGKNANFITGEVVGVGEGVQGVKTGQKVIISGYGGVEVDFQGRKAKFVNDTDILGVCV